MKESFWGAAVVGIGIVSIFFIYFFQSMTNTDEHNYHLLKESTEAAMLDALDLAAYRESGDKDTIRIDREKFVENFLRRFAESATLARTYKIEIFDVNEEPPKVSLKVSSLESSNFTGEIMNFDITNKIDAILEMPSV
ncbi:MAG: DUF5411 family protein [Bacilli bacterium]